MTTTTRDGGTVYTIQINNAVNDEGSQVKLKDLSKYSNNTAAAAAHKLSDSNNSNNNNNNNMKKKNIATPPKNNSGSNNFDKGNNNNKLLSQDETLTKSSAVDIGSKENVLPLQQESSSSSSSSILSKTTPNANNTVITLVSMGKLVDTYLVERCIRSIRKRGSFTGTILVFTDSIGYQRYQKTIPPWDDRTIILQSRDEDLHPRNETSNELKTYKQATMVFKRFKTHHSKYIAEIPALSDSIRYAMYIDVDNIIGNRLDGFFDDYAGLAAKEYPKAADFHRNFTTSARNNKNNNTDESDDGGGGFGFISMFRDTHLRSKMHGGILFFDLAFERHCIDSWRNEMDTLWESSDQIMFLRVLKDYDRYRCTVFDLPPKHMSFANKHIMTSGMIARQGKRGKQKRPLEYPTLIHVTGYRVKRLNNATVHDNFVRHILDLKENEMMTSDVRWEDTVPHMSKRKDII
mmetsp:Transcript_26651/g.29939  ORF Transcript_26651/g.29939 Transcript_26651/m.29939 type:complete len:462 (+) Transcript_26651:296-1681(+)